MTKKETKTTSSQPETAQAGEKTPVTMNADAVKETEGKKKSTQTTRNTKKDTPPQEANESYEDVEKKFIEEASKVHVPISVAMNELRANINNSIAAAQNSGLHIECILEVFRSIVSLLETTASQTAMEESTTYQKEIEEIRSKFKL